MNLFPKTPLIAGLTALGAFPPLPTPSALELANRGFQIDLVGTSKYTLQARYSYTAVPPDNPRLRGAPDNVLLNRSEGYEVLAFVQWFCRQLRLDAKAHGWVVERGVHKAPPHLHARTKIAAWIWLNWNQLSV